MTTITRFTKEQLIEQAKDNLIVLKNYVTVYPERAESEAMNIRLAEIALAALTAVPAMYCMEKGAALDIDATSTCKSVVEAWADEWNEMQCEHGDDFSAVALYRLPIVEGLIK
ncbi:hypothetical protein A6858_25315 [Salmonella enterica]|nr:hypothetical protein [Salmonella enterica]EAU0298137.1 hypothetical protein [Salmonella enterica]EBW8697961.1 hypothetical protein [Salmonella enterica subsp. diarizonae serovar 16:z10:e,n,x,z15]HAC8267859.1 hypothetical protein [Salmonella enterica]